MGFTPRAIRRVPRTGLVSSSGFSARPLDAKLRKGPVRGPRSINILKTPPFGDSDDPLWEHHQLYGHIKCMYIYLYIWFWPTVYMAVYLTNSRLKHRMYAVYKWFEPTLHMSWKSWEAMKWVEKSSWPHAHVP